MHAYERWMKNMYFAIKSAYLIEQFQMQLHATLKSFYYNDIFNLNQFLVSKFLRGIQHWTYNAFGKKEQLTKVLVLLDQWLAKTRFDGEQHVQKKNTMSKNSFSKSQGWEDERPAIEGIY